MTQHRDLKRRVRQRQAETGESYVTALRHVRAAVAAESPDPPTALAELLSLPVVELIDLTEIAEALGLRCRVTMYPDVLDQVNPSALLVELSRALRRPGFRAMRDVVVHGEPFHGPRELTESLKFYRRVRDGHTGASGDGRMIALSIAGKHGPVVVAFQLWVQPLALPGAPPPSLIVMSRDSWDLAWLP